MDEPGALPAFRAPDAGSLHQVSERGGQELELLAFAAGGAFGAALDGRWHTSAAEVTEVVAPPGPAGPAVRCRFRLAGGELVPGLRLRISVEEGFGSLRVAQATLEDGRALALAAVRPAGAPGHDRDRLCAEVLGDGSVEAVADARLSTTYGQAGEPLRVGLELWPESGEDETVYPRRAAGEIAGGPLALAGPGLEGRAWRVRWRSRGEGGHGVYALIGPRL